MQRKKILLTTVHRPLGIDSDTCTKNIQAEMYHAQVTMNQGPFSIRAVCTGWGLEFIAANIESPATVLHYPTLRTLKRELKKGYDYIGISFTICTFPKTIELCTIVREQFPLVTIVLGGYGTVLPECDRYADYVCREEGVGFFKRLLGETPVTRFAIPVIQRRLKVLSVSTGVELIIPTGLGCSRGCDFCCTSHFFKRQYHPLVTSGKEIHDFICSADVGSASYRDVAIIDEDFLMDHKRGMELAEWNAREIEKPILYSCLTSLKSLAQYTMPELLCTGLAGVWVGIESRHAHYAKLQNIDVQHSINELKQAGINVLTSMILGFDWHDVQSIEDDFQYLLSLRPTLSQLMLYSPCPQTPLYEIMEKENRLLKVPYQHYDGFHALFKHPHFSSEELETLILRLFEREFEELGPSIFRVLEVQLNGFEQHRCSDTPLFRRRAAEHKKLALQIYALLNTGIAKAPSARVKEYLRSLKDRSEALFPIPFTARTISAVVPILYFYTNFRTTAAPSRQPLQTVHRYHFAQ